MLCEATCVCGEHIRKEVRMLPHFLPYKTQCPSCGALVTLNYREHLENSMREAAARDQ